MKALAYTALFLFGIFLFVDPPSTNEMFKGVTYTGPGRGPIPPEMISSVAEIGANYIAYVPEATLARQDLTIRYNRSSEERGWYGESLEASMLGTQYAREHGLKVMIKPHIAVSFDLSSLVPRDGFPRDSAGRANFIRERRAFIASQPDLLKSRESWRGYIDVKDSDNWPTLAENYQEYILEIARFADSLGAESFAVGTELKELAINYPDYWRQVIREVRKVYSGQLTYAANWDSYDKIEFWDELDFIGIDAYFPLSDEMSPSVDSLVQAWQPYKQQIENLSNRFNKPVLFTEWGYESEHYAGQRPWESSGREFANGRPENDDHINLQIQADLYEATFRTFWNEPWFRGVIVWRWDPYIKSSTRTFVRTYNYTPKDKPAQDILQNWFNK